MRTHILYISLLFAVILISFESCKHNRNAQESLLDNLRISRDSTRHFKDKNNQLVSQVTVMTVTEKDLRKNSDLLGVDNKSLKQQIGKLSNLVLLYKGKQVVKGTGKTIAVNVFNVRQSPLDSNSFNKIDSSIIGKQVDWTNGFLTLSGFYNPINDSVDINYVYINSIDFKTYYGKRPSLFKPKPLLADVKMSDPNALIYDSWAILIQKPKRKWYQKPFIWGLATGLTGGFLLLK